jgi:hypothetical protein
MATIAREFIDFWVENSIHAAEQYGAPGGEQGATALARRCIEMAASQGLSKADLEKEVGDLTAFIRDKLTLANKRETNRRDRTPI